MRTTIIATLAILLMVSAAHSKTELKTCSANRAYCDAEARKRGWTRPQCAEAFTACMGSGEWHTTGPNGRTLSNVERR